MLITHSDDQDIFSDNECVQIDSFLQSLPYTCCNSLTAAHGFLSAIACAPSAPSYQEWLPFICSIELEPQKARTFALSLFKLYNIAKNQLSGKRPFEWLLWQNDKHIAYDNCSSELLARWCNGFLQGAAVDKQWQLDLHATELLLPLRVLAEPDASDNQTQQKSKNALFIHIKRLYDYWAEQRQQHTFSDELTLGESPKAIYRH